MRNANLIRLQLLFSEYQSHRAKHKRFYHPPRVNHIFNIACGVFLSRPSVLRNLITTLVGLNARARVTSRFQSFWHRAVSPGEVLPSRSHGASILEHVTDTGQRRGMPSSSLKLTLTESASDALSFEFHGNKLRIALTAI